MRRGAVAGIAAVLTVMIGVGVAVAASISCTGGRCEGTDGPDQIRGTDERDVIFGRGNRDEIFARDGRDELHGNGSGDSLCGEHHADFYNGGKQADLLSEFCRENNVEGAGNFDQSGPDTMLGGRGTDFIEGAGEGDEIRGMGGSDIVGSGQEPSGFIVLFGNEGDDEIHGGTKADGIAGEERDGESRRSGEGARGVLEQMGR